ncbi:MAG: hypothetical protein CMIDDMOC_00863 [Sodalis sp. Fle]|nr:MAG: hypothetical protein CMIDDMOC_00863 [Sodalis sp. Fle]
MKFSKMHTLGNDFMVLDTVTQNVYFTQDDPSAYRTDIARWDLINC